MSDRNFDKQISAEEFRNAMAHVFQSQDRDLDGVVTRAEGRAALAKVAAWGLELWPAAPRDTELREAVGHHLPGIGRAHLSIDVQDPAVHADVEGPAARE